LKTIFVLLFIILLPFWSCSPNRYQVTGQPGRIISLSPHITEILYALGQQQKIIAVTDFCTYPPQAKKKEKIGGLFNPNMEKIIALKPELLIGTPANAQLADKLSNWHFKFILLPNDRISDVYSTIDSLGKILNCKTKSDHLKALLKDSLSYYADLAVNNSKHAPKALLVIGRQQGSTRNIMAAGCNNFINTIWEMCGGKNAFPDLPAPYAQVSREALINRQPDIIIEFKFKEKWNANKNRKNYKEWQALTLIKAVKYKQIYVLTGNYTIIPGPRLYLLARDFSQIINRYHQQFSESFARRALK